MFTGLVNHTGAIMATRDLAQGLELTIATQYRELEVGESIAVNGACLTVMETDGQTFTCEVSPETLQKTTLGELNLGDAVNLERALCLGDRMGGHWVTGHIDTSARVSAVDVQDDFTVMQFADIAPADQLFLIAKGSITVDGVSLTINRVFAGGFSVTIIPHTLEITQLHQKSVGDTVNLEFDMITKTIVNTVKQLQMQSEILTNDAND